MKRDRILELYAEITGLPRIARVAQRGRDPETARYTFEFVDGRSVRIGSADVLWSQTRLGRLFGVTIGHVFPLIDRVDWHNAVAALVTHAVEVEEAPDQALTDHALDWLEQYLAGAGTSDADGAVDRREPFHSGEDVWVHAQHFARWLNREYSERIPTSELRTALVDLGFEPCRVQYNSNGTGKTRKRTTARYYRAPLRLIEEAERAE